MVNIRTRRALAASVGAWALTAAASVQAQDAPPQAGGGAGQLEGVVVTATRQSESINRIPLSVSAQTQQSLDQQGVHSVTDLQGIVPALQITQGSQGLAYPAIRGVSATGAAVTATVGVYIDDTPVQKRNGLGVAGPSGAPIPPLFDLDRIEVLRGPQGTLFGGGSEGGTIRFITPQPSLTRYSAYARAEVSTTEYGQPSYEGGVAVGGPLVDDKLGFRVSGWARHTGGWGDLMDLFTPGKVNFKDSNSGESRLGRVALAWAPTERSRLTLTYLTSQEDQASTINAYSLPVTSPIIEPTACYNTTGITPARPNANPTPVGLGDANCAALTAAGRANFTRPGATYGPYPDLGPGQYMWAFPAPTSTTLQISTATFDYDFGDVSFKSVSSYIRDRSITSVWSVPQLANRNANATVGGIPINRGLYFSSSCDMRCMQGMIFNQANARHGLVQEFRLASAAEARPLSWVAGVYYSNNRINAAPISSTEVEGVDLYGLTTEQRFGTPAAITGIGVANGFEVRHSYMKDVEAAAFGEANYWATEHLRLTAGIRLSRVDSSFTQDDYGPVAGFAVPTVANGGLSSGRAVESPITPRFTAQYEFNREQMIYVSASKGFRAGGANPPLPAAYCSVPLASYGLTVADVPTQYNADTVWNYEAGAKTRILGNRVQLNTSVYRLDWNNAQVSTTLGGQCNIAFTLNAGQARSQGVEVEAQAKLVQGFSANLSFSYNDAKYTADAVAIPANPAVANSRPLVAAIKDQKFDVPPITLELGARYDFRVGRTDAYLRGDWQYRAPIRGDASLTWGNSRYAPDVRFPKAQQVNLRLGMEYHGVDANLFVNNLFNEMAGAVNASGTSSAGGRTSCATAAQGGTPACTSFSYYGPISSAVPYYRPRQIGLQIAYRQ